MSINDKPTTEVDETLSNDLQEPQVDELTVLKERAKLMGIPHSPNIGLEALRKKIAEVQEGTPEPEPEQEAPAVNPLGEAPPVQRKLSLGQQLRLEQTRLVRVRIQNLDPKKKDLPGEIITVANEYIGTVRKFVPFGEATDDGYHIPYCIYNFLKNRQFLQINVSKKNGQQVVKTAMVREFAIEELPPLTEEELAHLAQAQTAAGSLKDD